MSTRTECVKVGFVQNSCFPPFLVSRSSSVAVFTNCKLAFSLPCLYAHIKAVLISSELNGGGTIEHNIQNGVDFRTFSLVQRSVIVRLVFSGNKVNEQGCRTFTHLFFSLWLRFSEVGKYVQRNSGLDTRQKKRAAAPKGLDSIPNSSSNTSHLLQCRQ